MNASLESLRWVRIELNGPGIATPPFVPRLGPGETLEVDVRGADLPRATRMVVRWLRENGDEYLWGVAF